MSTVARWLVAIWLSTALLVAVTGLRTTVLGARTDDHGQHPHHRLTNSPTVTRLPLTTPWPPVPPLPLPPP